MGLGYVDSLLLQVTVFFQIQGGIQWRAVVGFVRRHIAWQTQTLVGTFRVDALGILAERHPVVQLITFIYIDTGHLGHIQVIAVEAVTGITFLHPHTAAVFTSVEDAAFLSLQLLKAI